MMRSFYDKNALILRLQELSADAITRIKSQHPSYVGHDFQQKLDSIPNSVPVTRHMFQVLGFDGHEMYTTGLRNWLTPTVILRCVTVDLSGGSGSSSANGAALFHGGEHLPDAKDFKLCKGWYLGPSMEYFFDATSMYRVLKANKCTAEEVEPFGFYSVGDLISIPGNNGKAHADDSLNCFLVLGVLCHAQVLPSVDSDLPQPVGGNPNRVLLVLKRLIGELPEPHPSLFADEQIEILEWTIDHASTLLWHCELYVDRCRSSARSYISLHFLLMNFALLQLQIRYSWEADSVAYTPAFAGVFVCHVQHHEKLDDAFAFANTTRLKSVCRHKGDQHPQ